MASYLITLSLSAAMAMSVMSAHAQEQLDPTRPPIGIRTPSVEYHADSGGLQAVMISPTRRAAIINGQTVVLGGNYGNERLIEVSEGRAVLENEHGRRELRVFSNLGMQRRAAAPAKQHLRIKPAGVAADKGKP
jgi:MSHA biogenesis protein MshK